MGSARPIPTLTLEEAKRLQRELYNGFNEDEFRDRLDELEARVGRACENYTKEHTALFLTVQNEVLPKYGFPPGEVGVLQMLQASARFNDDEQFRKNRDMLNETLGLSRTPEEERSRAEEVARQLPREVRVLKLPGGPAIEKSQMEQEQPLPEPSHCPKGHSLKEFKTTNDKVTCDRCSAQQARGVAMSGCRTCDFDVCLSCFDPRKPGTAGSSSKNAQSPAPPNSAASPGVADAAATAAAAAAAAAAGYPASASATSAQVPRVVGPPMVTEHLRWRPPSAFGLGQGLGSGLGGSSSSSAVSSSVTALARAAVSSSKAATSKATGAKSATAPASTPAGATGV